MYGLPKNVCVVPVIPVSIYLYDLDAPSICFVFCFCMLEVISSLRSLRDGSQVFAYRCFAYYVFG